MHDNRYRLSNLESNPVNTIGQSHIKRVTNKKSLGLILDDRLKWKTHIDNQSKKMPGNIALLKRARPFLSMHSRLKMFNAHVLPYITYCLIVQQYGMMELVQLLRNLLNYKGEQLVQ